MFFQQFENTLDDWSVLVCGEPAVGFRWCCSCVRCLIWDHAQAATSLDHRRVANSSRA